MRKNFEKGDDIMTTEHSTMTKDQRNTIFEEYINIIRFTVNNHHSMLKVLRMDAEDLTQELAICLLKAIEKYDAERGAKQSTYYFMALRYGALKLWREQMRSNRIANLRAMSLTWDGGSGRYGGMGCSGNAGYVRSGKSRDCGGSFEIDVPYNVDYDDALMVNEFLKTLSEYERIMLSQKMQGYEPADVRHSRFMKIIKRKAMRFCAAGGLA